MGLLDQFTDFINTPGGQGLLSAGLGALGSRTALGGISRGGLLGLQAYTGAQDRQNFDARQKAMDERSGKMFELQLAQHQASLEKAKQAAEQQQMQQNYIGGIGKVTSPRIGAEPNKANPYSMLAMGMSPEMTNTVMNAPTMGLPEVARTVEVDDGKGGKATMQLDKFGRPVGENLRGYTAPVQVNRGNKIDFVNPQVGASFSIAPTPFQTARLGAIGGGAGPRASSGGGAGGATQPTGKPMPAAALKMRQEAFDAIGTAGTISSDLGAINGLIQGGKLDLGPVSNVVSEARNYAGLSNEGSKNYQTFKATLEKLRNDSLRLNKGVQTDGDAQRAWNELLTNINDPGVVQQRLQEIDAINRRAMELHQFNLDQIDANYGRPATDTSTLRNQPTALGGASPAPQSQPQQPRPQAPQQPKATNGAPAVGETRGGYRFKGGNPADRNNWQKV
jgi:hypothetical protein